MPLRGTTLHDSHVTNQFLIKHLTTSLRKEFQYQPPFEDDKNRHGKSTQFNQYAIASQLLEHLHKCSGNNTPKIVANQIPNS